LPAESRKRARSRQSEEGDGEHMETTQTLFDDTYTGPRWTYGLRNRPLSIGAQPRGWIIDSLKGEGDGGRFRFGTIDYPRELTPEEVSGYELEFVAGPGGAAKGDAATVKSWTYHNDSDDGRSYRIEEEGFGIVADVSNMGNTPMEDMLLHAAAPELVDVVRDFIDAATEAGKSESYKANAYGYMLGLLPKARKALAKAEGR